LLGTVEQRTAAFVKWMWVCGQIFINALSLARHCEELATKLQSNFALKRRSNPSIRAWRGGLLRWRSQ
jgi:hypothetical protein